MPWSTNGWWVYPTDDDAVIGKIGDKIAIPVYDDEGNMATPAARVRANLIVTAVNAWLQTRGEV